MISGGWHTEVGLPVAEISGPNRVLEVPTDDRFGYGQRVLRWFMHERQSGAETGQSRDCDGAPRFDPLPTFVPEFCTPLNPSDS